MTTTTPQQEAKARRVLERFVRVYVTTYAERRLHRSLALLKDAFHTASTYRRVHQYQTRGRTRMHDEHLAEKRHQLTQKYSASYVRPLTPPETLDAHHVIIPKSSFQFADAPSDALEEPHRDSDSEDAEYLHQHVTVEVVVQHLHAQLEQSRDEIMERNRRIRELEAHVASLEVENKQLKEALRRSLKIVPVSDARYSNQTLISEVGYKKINDL